jgi:hypothetical protein
VCVSFYDENETKTFDGPGTWSFFWALDGRIVQDVLIYPNPLGGDRRIGTTLRFRGGDRSPWRIVWVGATSGAFTVLDGRRVEEDIVIEGADPSGARVRAVFSEIARERFDWKSLRSTDGGRSFRLEQRIVAERSVPSR